MAHKGVELNPENFSCSVCLDLPTEPVSVPCGHSYCMSCIKGFWGEEGENKVSSCPQCRQTFTPRPVLVKNTMLAVLVEELNKAGLQAAPADCCQAGPEDVACDFCTGRKLKASKSCLSCLASYCEKHLQPHYDVAPLKRHKLVAPSKKLQDNVCPRHDESVKMFCRTDQESICCFCLVEKHKGHDAVSAEAERTERQKVVQGSRKKIQKRIQDLEEEVDLLQQEMEAIDCSADKTVASSLDIFKALIQFIERKSSDVQQSIRSQQKTEVSRVKELQETLLQEISELEGKDAVLERLARTEDHTQFLRNCPSLSQLAEPTLSSTVDVRPLSYFEDVTAAVSKIRDKLQATLTTDCTNILVRVPKVDVLLLEPVTRNDFLKYSCELTLDVNTAHRCLALSNENRAVTIQRYANVYPSNEERFTECVQVLSKESLSGRHYWEVNWNGHGVSIAVASKNIDRRGSSETCGFGLNDKSWALHCYPGDYYFQYNNVKTKLYCHISSSIGVYLDHRAGTLSFFNVSGTVALIHKVQARFTEPLLAGFGNNNGFESDRFEILKLK